MLDEYNASGRQPFARNGAAKMKMGSLELGGAQLRVGWHDAICASLLPFCLQKARVQFPSRESRFSTCSMP
jgi:hypothetical protein